MAARKKRKMDALKELSDFINNISESEEEEKENENFQRA